MRRDVADLLPPKRQKPVRGPLRIENNGGPAAVSGGSAAAAPFRRLRRCSRSRGPCTDPRSFGSQKAVHTSQSFISCTQTRTRQRFPRLQVSGGWRERLEELLPAELRAAAPRAARGAPRAEAAPAAPSSCGNISGGSAPACARSSSSRAPPFRRRNRRNHWRDARPKLRKDIYFRMAETARARTRLLFCFTR